MYFWKSVLIVGFCIVIPLWVILLLWEYFTSIFLVSNTIGILFLAASVYLPVKTIRFLRKRNAGKPFCEIHKDNILIEYLRAKKEKICPIIEYVD